MKLTATTKAEAFEKARFYIEDFALDIESTSRAGYPVHRSEREYYSYICDLGNRLEVNLANGETLNIFIETEAEITVELETRNGFKKTLSYVEMVSEIRFWFGSGERVSIETEFENIANLIKETHSTKVTILRSGLNFTFSAT